MRIIQINPFQQPKIVKNIILVYQQTFGMDPWNEGYKCPICSECTGLLNKKNYCENCFLKNGWQVMLIEHWPNYRVLSDFYLEMRKKESLCLVAFERQKVVGFAWGYKISINKKTSKYLDAPKLEKVLKGNFFYLDEVAVLPSYQKSGIGRKLIKEIIQTQIQKRFLLRTLFDSQMYHLTKKIGGEVVQKISKNRVIMTG